MTQVTIDGLGVVFDDETGEIIEAVEASSEARLRRWGEALIEAQTQRASWDTHVTFLKQLIAGELRRLDAPAFQTETFMLKAVPGYDRRTGRPEQVPAVARRFELSREQVQAIWETAKELDAKALDALVEARVIPLDVAAALIERKTTAGYIKAQVVRRPAPQAVRR